MSWRYYFAALVGLHLACASVAHSQEPGQSLTNPVLPSGQDPWVVQWQGDYYLCQSRGAAGLAVSRSATVSGVGQTNWVTVWTPPPDTAWSKNIWAPEIHLLRGRWYLYFAADDGENANHRMYVLEGSSGSPQDPFRFLGKVAAPTDRWAIDGTVLEMPDGALFLLWSGWEGWENVAQNIYIAPMSNPWTISGERVLLSRPEFDWEKNGRPLVNEAPQVLWNGPHLFVIYSASGSWTDDHCLGQLRWLGGDPRDPKTWVKHSRPVFARTAHVFGPGHPSFVKSPDGKEDWIIYHSARSQGAGWRRQINMQPFSWREDGSPDFGSPIAPGVPIPVPSGKRASAPALAPGSTD